jgi:hypothetical protein
MAEVLVEFETVLADREGRRFGARACGRQREDGLWEGWIEFPAIAGNEVLRTERETTQPNRDDLLYWATGLTDPYLDGALLRVQRGAGATTVQRDGRSTSARTTAAPHPVLDPFQVYAEGPDILRGQLLALGPDHLRAIAVHHMITDPRGTPVNVLPKHELVALIVTEVERRARP